jgi:cell division septation protein DedD
VDEDLSYQARLEGKVPPADSVKAAQPAAKPAAGPPPAAPPPAAAQAAVNDAGGAGWLVQVQALRDRASADGVAKRLAGKGYKAFVMSPGPKGSRLYRVVVGRFKTRGEAEEAKRRLEKEEKFKPWIIS